MIELQATERPCFVDIAREKFPDGEQYDIIEECGYECDKYACPKEICDHCCIDGALEDEYTELRESKCRDCEHVCKAVLLVCGLIDKEEIG